MDLCLGHIGTRGQPRHRRSRRHQLGHRGPGQTARDRTQATPGQRGLARRHRCSLVELDAGRSEAGRVRQVRRRHTRQACRQAGRHRASHRVSHRQYIHDRLHSGVRRRLAPGGSIALATLDPTWRSSRRKNPRRRWRSRIARTARRWQQLSVCAPSTRGCPGHDPLPGTLHAPRPRCPSSSAACLPACSRYALVRRHE